MTLSDLAAGVATIAIFALLKTRHLEDWRLCAAAAVGGFFYRPVRDVETPLPDAEPAAPTT